MSEYLQKNSRCSLSLKKKPKKEPKTRNKGADIYYVKEQK